LQGLFAKVHALLRHKAGQPLATLYDDEALDRIRTVLVAHMQQHHMGTPAAEQLTHVPRRTVHRLITGERVNDGALKLIEKFLGRLPNKPTAMQALGHALHAIYGKPPDIRAGTYSVMAHKTVISEITITAPTDQTFLFVKETTASTYRRIYDGVIVCDGSNRFAILKDRLMHTARLHALNLNPTAQSFRGVVYDNGNLESGDIQYRPAHEPAAAHG
jgi:hypothetical protein